MIQTIASAIVSCNGKGNCDTGLPVVAADSNNVQVALQITFGVVGALAILMIIISSFRLASSEGNPQEATKARQGIIYSAVGLILALSAEAIVTFVLGSV